jgi:26S proteasome regulatory subunit N8
LKALVQRLSEIKAYLQNVLNGRLIPNPLIINNIQEVFNHLPNFETDEMIKSLSVQTNNNYLVLYLGWLVRTVISLHKLINNKITLREDPEKKEEKKDEKKKEENKESQDKESKESKEKEAKK